jgi:uncharacterized protein YkwD
LGRKKLAIGSPLDGGHQAPAILARSRSELSWLTWLVSLFGKRKPAPPAADPSAALLAATNAARATARLAPLRGDPRLQAMAQGYAAELARTGILAHGDFVGRLRASGYPFRRAGENLAAGWATPQAAVAAWLADPAHRANLLGGFTDCGLAGHPSPSGTWYWCADYGTKS